MKKIASFILSIVICFMNFTLLSVAEPLKGSVSESSEYKQTQDDIFTGKVESLNHKDVINMTVSQVLDSSISVEGDEFFAVQTHNFGFGDCYLPCSCAGNTDYLLFLCLWQVDIQQKEKANRRYRLSD